MKRQALRSPALRIRKCSPILTSGISSPFSELFQASRQIAHVLRTLAPLRLQNIATLKSAFDLHVLSTPPAFVLSQNQTLRIKTLARFLSGRKTGQLLTVKTLQAWPTNWPP